MFNLQLSKNPRTQILRKNNKLLNLNPAQFFDYFALCFCEKTILFCRICASGKTIFPKQKEARLGRGSYLSSIELPSYSRICHRQPRYLSPGTSAQVPSPAANSYYSRISHRQPRYLSPCTSAQVPKPRYLAQLPIAHIPGLLVVRVPRPGYLSLST